MMKPVTCRVSEVTSLQNSPILISFKDKLNPNKLRYGLYAHKKTGKRMVAAALSDDGVFLGSELPAMSNLEMSMIAIRNKRTNEVRLIPTTNVMLSQVSHVAKSNSVSEVTEADKDRLGMKFGSKKRQRSLEQIKRMQADTDIQKNKMKDMIDDTVIKQDDLRPVGDNPNEAHFPLMNRNAGTVDQVYNLYDIVSAEELASLKKEAHSIMMAPQNIKEDMYSIFFRDCLTKMSNGSNKQESLESFCVLLYADLLVNFLKQPTKCLKKRNLVICSYSEDINSKILRTFTIESPNGRLRPTSMKDKAYCQLIVLGLLLTKFELDLELLSKSLAVHIKKLKQISRQLGTVSGPKNSSIVVLKLPLPLLEDTKVFKKMKK